MSLHRAHTACRIERFLAPQSIALPLLSGAFAATCAWGVGYPADVIKTRVQAMNSKATDKGGTSIEAATRSLLREANGDVRVLYRGIGLKLVRAVPMNALGFLGTTNPLASLKN